MSSNERFHHQDDNMMQIIESRRYRLAPHLLGLEEIEERGSIVYKAARFGNS
jgi:hypothetical protein